jgi:hypothetical protein
MMFGVQGELLINPSYGCISAGAATACSTWCLPMGRVSTGVATRQRAVAARTARQVHLKVQQIGGRDTAAPHLCRPFSWLATSGRYFQNLVRPPGGIGLTTHGQHHRRRQGASRSNVAALQARAPPWPSNMPSYMTATPERSLQDVPQLAFLHLDPLGFLLLRP